MKIICAGFWKTGTKSLAHALRILGYKVYDYDDQYFNLADLWEKFFDGTVTDDDIREQLKDIDVLIDGPVIAFWSEIHRAIPESKVILTFRDEDSWWKSFRGTGLYGPSVLNPVTLLFYLVPAAHRFMRIATRVVNICIGVEGSFKFPLYNITNNPRLYKLQYRKHNTLVKQTVVKESLLVLEPGDGWGPLCQFLGRDIPPDQSYPHKNQKNAHFTTEGGPQNPKIRAVLYQSIALASILVAFFAYFVYYVIHHLL